MRTTLTIDDDVMDLAVRLAKARGVSIGKAVSDLMRRGVAAPTAAATRNGVVMFVLPDDSPRVTSDTVRRLESEGA